MKNRIILLGLIICFTQEFYAQNSADFKQNYFSNSIISKTSTSLNHKTLAEAVVAAGLDGVLDSDGPFTVFAPSDNAFKQLSSDEISSLLQPGNRAKLRSLISYHIVAGNLSASKILKAMCRGGGSAEFTSVQGNRITATMDGIDIVLSDSLGNKARIVAADDNRCNGVIHVIDSLIFP